MICSLIIFQYPLFLSKLDNIRLYHSKMCINTLCACVCAYVLESTQLYVSLSHTYTLSSSIHNLLVVSRWGRYEISFNVKKQSFWTGILNRDKGNNNRMNATFIWLNLWSEQNFKQSIKQFANYITHKYINNNSCIKV